MMAIKFSQLQNIKVVFKDYTLGKLYDFYFDDSSFKIKDLIIKKGFGTKAKLSSFNINKVEELRNKRLILKTNYNDELKTPILHSDYVMSKNFGWPNIWSVAGDVIDENGLLESDNYTPNLRSILEVRGYKIKSDNKYIGYICDCLVDYNNWKIISVVVNNGKFLPSFRKQIINTQKVHLKLKYPTAVVFI